MPLFRRRSGARRRNPALTAAALLVLALVGLDYALGLAIDTVQVVDRSSAGIGAGTLKACGASHPLRRELVNRHHWRATLSRLCAGETSLTLSMQDGSVDTCTAFDVRPRKDWRVIVTDTGCGGFEATTLPAI